MGRLTTITDTKGSATKYQYDFKGRITKETYADGGEIVQTYDSEGKLIRRVDQKQQVIEYKYDSRGRLIEKNYGPTGVQTYGYDSFGRLASTTDNNDGRMEVKTELTYNGQHQNIAETLKIANDPAQTIHKTYDKVGRLMALRYPSGREVRTTYTELGQTDQILSKVAGFANAVVDYDYGYDLGETNPVLRRKKLYNGIQAELDVDSRGRSTRIDWKQNGSTLVGFEYAYNWLGDRVQDIHLHNSRFNETYRYDNARRLAGYERADGKRQNWTLDGLGNWEGFSFSGNAAGSGAGGGVETRTHNAMNEILTIAGGTTPQVLDHDDNGNMVAYNNKAYSWDANNRLMGVTRNTASGTEYVAKYYYTAMNHRVLKHTDSNGDGLLDAEVVYVSNGEQTVAEQNRNGSLLREHIFGGQFVDEIVLTVDAVRGSENFSLADLRYSVFAVVGANGVLVERYAYDPYGKRTVMNAGYGVMNASSIGQEFGYTGRQHDIEASGLMYFRARYYSVDLGRFVGRDPLGTALDVNWMNWLNELEAGSYFQDGISLYRGYFVVSGVDPSGENTACPKCTSELINTTLIGPCGPCKNSMKLCRYSSTKVTKCKNKPDVVKHGYTHYLPTICNATYPPQQDKVEFFDGIYSQNEASIIVITVFEDGKKRVDTRCPMSFEVKSLQNTTKTIARN